MRCVCLCVNICLSTAYTVPYSFLHRHSLSCDLLPIPIYYLSTLTATFHKPSLYPRVPWPLQSVPSSSHPIPASVALRRSNTTVEHHDLYLRDCNPHFDIMLLPVGKTYCRTRYGRETCTIARILL